MFVVRNLDFHLIPNVLERSNYVAGALLSNIDFEYTYGQRGGSVVSGVVRYRSKPTGNDNHLRAGRFVRLSKTYN